MNDRGSESMLVVDDDTVFRKRLARAFRDRGFDVRESATIQEAILAVREDPPARVVLDLKLGEESGLQFLQQMNDENSSIKVVVLTGYGTIATTVHALKLGAVNYLTKPVDADTVLAAFMDRQQKEVLPLRTPHLAQVEWDHIQRVVHDHDGNISQASKALGLHRRSLQRKLIKAPQKLK